MASRLLAACLLGLIWLSVARPLTAQVSPSTSDEPTPPAASDGQLTMRGRVLLPDGAPAAGALVGVVSSNGAPLVKAHADADGRFELRHDFFHDARVQARSADGKFQTTFRLPPAAARRTLAEPIELKLSPARSHVVTVTADGQPVADAQVAAVGIGTLYIVHGATDTNGVARLLIPATEQLDALVAWHPKLGVAGKRGLSDAEPTAATELSIFKPAPHTIRVVDATGKPVPDVLLTASVRVADDWILSSHFDDAHLRTNAQGEATAPWFPADNLQYVDVEFVSDGWKEDETDFDSTDNGLTVVHARRLIPVEGKLVMPAGASAAGVYITGFAFGPGSTGQIPTARARGDGSFTMLVASDHGYVLGVSDLDWTSDLWSGLVLPADDATPADVRLEAYPATPVTIRVTRGPDRQGAADMWIELSRNKEFHWTDASGEERTGTTGVEGWLRTDSRGEAHGAAARGVNEARVGTTTWNESKEFEVKDDSPVTVEFHRDWLAERTLLVRLTRNGDPYSPSPTTRVVAWGPADQYVPIVKEPAIDDDGVFKVAFDAPTIGVVVIDPELRLAAYGKAGPADDRLDLAMTPAASYRGVAVDEQDQPLAGVDVSFKIKDTRVEPAKPLTTDATGAFSFDALPAKTPLWLSASKDPRHGSAYKDKLLAPGEVREEPLEVFEFWDDDDDQPSAAPAAVAAAPPLAPLPERLAILIRDVRLAGMHALVIAEGDEADDTTAVTREATNTGNHADVLAYRALVIPADELKTQAALLDERHWRPPSAGEIALYAVDGDGRTLAQEVVPVADRAAAVDRATTFVAEHAPPRRDAETMLAAANDEARRTNRRVLLVEGGPRCGPCFRLARWMDDHHELLEEDYVILKIMGGRDLNAAEVIRQFRPGFAGIPWTAIADPDGKILATSDSPLGNTGFPTTVEDVRHWRQMLESTARKLTSRELDEIVESLLQQ